MKRLLYIYCALLFAGCLCASPALGQSAGGAFAVPVGGVIGGGGTSAGGAFGLEGAVLIPGGGTSNGTAFRVEGGMTAVLAGGVAAFYDGKLVDTIPPGSRLLKVAFQGGSGPATGKFFYRFMGQLSYTGLNMGAGAGDTLLFTVPAGLLGPRGLEYYFAVTRGPNSGFAGSPAIPYQYVMRYTGGTQAFGPAATPKESYRIVSVPIDIAGTNTVTGIFGDDLGAYDTKQWRLFRYRADSAANIEFPNADNVVPGRAYWLITRDPKFYGAQGITRRPNRTEGGVTYFEVQLDSGWNQLANPLSFPVNWTEVLFDTAGGNVVGHDPLVLEDSAYWYNGSGYQTVTTIPAWGGVFVNIKMAGVKALFRYHEAGAVLSRQQPPDRLEPTAANWDIELRLATPGQTDAGNFLGVRSDAATGADRYDFSEPPPAPNGAQLAFKLPDDTPGLKRSDFRPAFRDGATWELVLPRATDRTLTAHGLDRIPAGMSATLLLDAGIVVDLAEGKSLSIPNDVRSARLVIGNSAYTAGSESTLLPRAFALYQNFPNPFNPDTRIRFALPADTKLRITVFNVLGQKVRTLADDVYPAGTHDIIWDGRNDQGSRVGSGVYFYRLRSDAFTETRRMMLIK